MLTLEQVAQIVGGELVGRREGGRQESVPRGFSIDSRTIVEGDLFFALVGPRFDGHAFLEEVARKGAVGAVISRAWNGQGKCLDRQGATPEEGGTIPLGLAVIFVQDTLAALQEVARHLRRLTKAKVIAVGGSCGKTTTKEMLREIVSLAGPCVATAGNENNHIGVPLTLLKLKEGVGGFAVVEMGSSAPGEMVRLVQIGEPDVGLITCITPTHTQFLGDIEGVAREESALFAGLRAGGVAVVNLDDERVRCMSTGGAQRVTFSAQPHTWPHADVLLLEADGAHTGLTGAQRLRISLSGRETTVYLSLIGRHNAINALAAAAAAHAAGIGEEAVRMGLERARAAKGRGRVFDCGRFMVIDESYNSSPAAALAALASLREFTHPKIRRRVALLGDMLELGSQAPRYHREVGKFAAGATDFIVAVGEFAEELLAGAREGGAGADRLLAVRSAFEAAEVLVEGGMLREGDLLLVKGSRGVKMEVIVRRLVGLGVGGGVGGGDER